MVTSDIWISIWSSCMSVLRPSPSPTVYTKHSVCTKHSGLHSTYQHSTSSTPFSSTGCNPWPAGSLACRADGWPSHRWPTWPTEVRRTLGSGISSRRSASREKCTFSSMKSYVCIIYIYILYIISTYKCILIIMIIKSKLLMLPWIPGSKRSPSLILLWMCCVCFMPCVVWSPATGLGLLVDGHEEIVVAWRILTSKLSNSEWMGFLGNIYRTPWGFNVFQCCVYHQI